MSPFVNSAGVSDPRCKKVYEWYGEAFTFSPQEREKILQIIKFDEELNDQDLLFDRIILDCHVYLYEHRLKLDVENSKNLKKHLRTLRKKFDDLMMVLAEGCDIRYC
ncbi:MAG: hypothetical protein RBR34_07560 [Rhodospirillaceae bacterium]|nr:hypothetical protein [Rhodospirillaceae bacterium]